jgi:hypothetical protein
MNKNVELVIVLLSIFALIDSLFTFGTANGQGNSSYNTNSIKNAVPLNTTIVNTSRSLASPLPPIKLTPLERVPIPSPEVQKNLEKAMEQTHTYPRQFM